MKKQSQLSSHPILAAYFDLECGIALVSLDDLKWLARCPDVTARRGKPWKFDFHGAARCFEVIPVRPSLVVNADPKEGARRRFRHARCGGDQPAVEIDCFPLTSGRSAKIELAGYSTCIRAEEDTFCDETYVKIGVITIFADRFCKEVAQLQPQFRWLCLP